MNLKMHKSFYIKLLVVGIGILISASTLFYTRSLIDNLQKKERRLAEMYAGILNHLISSNLTSGDNNFLIENIISRIDFPIIITEFNGKDDTIDLNNLSINSKNIVIEEKLTSKEKIIYLQTLIKNLDYHIKPIEIKYQNRIISRIHFGDSDLVIKLRYYPYLQILFAFFFVLVAYLSFSHIKKSEESNIWIGLSKETAHQLGTPISSLLGWNEYLKLNSGDQTKVTDISDEIQNDLERLSKITQRFSKIGSKPELKLENIYLILEKNMFYFQRRIPQLGKNIEIRLTGDENIKAKICVELFEWVIENLTKNALDAIENRSGIILFELKETAEKIKVLVTDNGKGIESKNKKRIFIAGFSTKKRGWGLGLSLSKRIIEDYHHGKLSLKNSEPNTATVFEVILNK